MAASNRPTVSQVASQLADVQQGLTETRHHVSVLQRKARGTTLANARCAQLERRFADIETRFTDVQAAGDPNDPRYDAVVQELSRLEGNIQSLGRDVRGQLAELNNRVSVLEDHPSQPFDLSRTTVTSTANAQQAHNVLPALIVGAVGGVLMYIGIENFGFLPKWREDALGAAIIVALAAFFITLGLTSTVTVQVASRLNLFRIPEPQLEPEQPPVVVDDAPEAPNHTTVMPVLDAEPDARPMTNEELSELLHGRPPAQTH